MSDAAVAEDAGREADSAAEAEGPREAGPLKRLVYERSPFGNLDRAGDLLVDPDFEWSTGRGQTGWVAQSDTGVVRVPVETGGICRSGLRCLRLEGAVSVLGYGIGATHGSTKLSFWAKVEGSSCAQVDGYFVRGMTYVVLPNPRITAVDAAPDATGWCRFEGIIPAQAEPIDVYIERKATATSASIILDDASMVAADGMSALRAEAAEPMDEATRARVASRLEWLRKHRQYGRGMLGGSAD